MFLNILILFITNSNQVNGQSSPFSDYTKTLQLVEPFVSKLDCDKVKFANNEKILDGKILAPDSIAEYDGYFYAGDMNGQIVKFNETSVTSLPEIPGAKNGKRRFFGLRIFDGVIIAVDTFNGVYSIDLKTCNYTSTELLLSYGENGNLKYPFLDDFDMDVATQTLYIATATQKFNETELGKVTQIGFTDNTGMVIKYNLKTKKEEILIQNLYFCNGIQLSPNYDFLLISEYTRARVSRYILTGPNAGTLNVITKTPGLPDNIRLSSSGGYWVAVTRNVTLTNKQYLECVALEIDEDGLTKQVIIPKGNVPCSVTQVSDLNGKLYFGSITNEYVLKVTP